MGTVFRGGEVLKEIIWTGTKVVSAGGVRLALRKEVSAHLM